MREEEDDEEDDEEEDALGSEWMSFSFSWIFSEVKR